MRRGLDKRGAEEPGVGVWLIVAIFAAVIILLFISGAFGSITDIFKKSNVDITFINQKCAQLASVADNSGFCTDRIEISSNTYVNCPYAIKNLGANVTTTLICDDTTAITAICNKLKLEGANMAKLKVNNQPCPA